MTEAWTGQPQQLQFEPTARPVSRRIGFVSTRLAGTDGVSLETRKWSQVLEAGGHACFYFAGTSDHPPPHSYTVAEAAFDHPAVEAVGMLAFSRGWGDAELRELTNPEMCRANTRPHGGQLRPPAVSRRIRELADHLKTELYEFVRLYDLELFIVENALSIPMNLALGVALTELIAETGLPTIAHHHDFYWERKRFHANCVPDYLDLAFPPRLPSIRHVVINSLAARALSMAQRGLSSILDPQRDGFRQPAAGTGRLCALLARGAGTGRRRAAGAAANGVVQRKIEHAIELTRRLDRPARLVISHASGDEDSDYAQRIRDFAELLGVRLCFADDLIAPERGVGPAGERRYRLGDMYSQADLVTYPSLEEGFGNALLEAIYFGRPVVVNNFLIYDVDIKPKGFRVIEFEDFIAACTVRQVQAVLADPGLAAAHGRDQLQLARRHYSTRCWSAGCKCS